METETKRCKTCGDTKSVSEFYLNRILGYYSTECKECVRRRSRDRYHADPNKAKERYRKWYLKRKAEMKEAPHD